GELRICGPIRRNQVGPATPLDIAALADAGRKMFADAVGNEKLRIFGPAIAALRQANLFFAQRLAVCFSLVLLVWRAVANVAVQDDECGTSFGLLESLQSLLNPIDVVGIAHPQDIPTVAEKPARDVLRERDLRATLDRDVVVVIDPAEV